MANSLNNAFSLMVSLLHLNEIRLDVNACVVCGSTNLFIETRVRQLRSERDAAAAGTLSWLLNWKN